MRKPNKLEMFALTMGGAMSVVSLGVIVAVLNLSTPQEDALEIELNDENTQTILESPDYQQPRF